MTRQDLLADRWPDLLALLSVPQRRAVLNALAAGWHEGWEPNREDVSDLVDYARGAITTEEYQERSIAKVRNII